MDKSEADKIRKLVEERQREAMKKKVPHLVLKIWESCKHMPSWLAHGYKSEVPAIVKAGTPLSSDKTQKKESFSITLDNGSEFCFEFKRGGSFDGTDFADLVLNVNGSMVCMASLAMSYDYKRSYTIPEWSPIKVDAYLPGEWEASLELIDLAMSKLDEERKLRAHTDDAELNDLKKKFGI